jgi:DNA-binding response OmpR family regulator
MGEIVKVLVVDDDRRMVKTICDILKIKGYESVPAYSGEEAVEKIKEGKPDCVLMDIKMPGIDGVEAMGRIKAVAADLPVVLMSAFASEEQAEAAQLRGACAVLTKPIDFQQVLSFLALLRNEDCILVVDDDPAFSRTLKDILQATGYRVETAVDPDGALGHLRRESQLAVILDLRLGTTVDGLDVLKEIRAGYPERPVVLVTGYRDEMAGSIESGLAVGAHTCLFKPFALEELIGIIAEIRRRKRRKAFGEPV